MSTTRKPGERLPENVMKKFRESRIRLHNPYGEYIDVHAMIEKHREEQISGKKR